MLCAIDNTMKNILHIYNLPSINGNPRERIKVNIYRGVNI